MIVAARTRSTDDIEVHLEGDPGTVAHALRPLLTTVLGRRLPVRVELWDGSAVGPVDGPGVLRVRSPNALRRLLWAPDEIGLSRAYVMGELDLDGDIFETLQALRDAVTLDSGLAIRLAPRALAAARATGALGAPLPPPRGGGAAPRPPALAASATRPPSATTTTSATTSTSWCSARR